MIIVLKENAPQQAAEKLMKEIRAKGLQIDVSKGTRKTVLGLVGDTSVIDMEHVQGYDYVDKVLRVEEPGKPRISSAKFDHPCRRCGNRR